MISANEARKASLEAAAAEMARRKAELAPYMDAARGKLESLINEATKAGEFEACFTMPTEDIEANALCAAVRELIGYGYETTVIFDEFAFKVRIMWHCESGEMRAR